MSPSPSVGPDKRPVPAGGAATPLAASAVAGTMAVAYRTAHRPNGYFITAEGWEYAGFISASAVALAALGPGPRNRMPQKHFPHDRRTT